MQLICPDKWKEGSTNGAIGKGGRALATNTLAKKSSRYTPYSSKCEICKSPLHQQGKYCHPCAYGKGVPLGVIAFVLATTACLY